MLRLFQQAHTKHSLGKWAPRSNLVCSPNWRVCKTKSRQSKPLGSCTLLTDFYEWLKKMCYLFLKFDLGPSANQSWNNRRVSWSSSASLNQNSFVKRNRFEIVVAMRQLSLLLVVATKFGPWKAWNQDRKNAFLYLYFLRHAQTASLLNYWMILALAVCSCSQIATTGLFAERFSNGVVTLVRQNIPLFTSNKFP